MADKSLDNDNRVFEQDRKRDNDQKHKWALGPHLITQRGTYEPINTGRPQKCWSATAANAMNRPNHTLHIRDTKRTNIARAQDERVSIDILNIPDPYPDEENGIPSKGSRPEAECFYSFDARQGPAGHNRDYLGQAVARAEEAWESKAAIKLVRDEYEVVGRHTEAEVESRMDEDGFELL